MATYQFSALADGQAISFSPTADVLNFDQSVIAAADIRVTTVGTSTRIEVVSGPHAGKDITLLNTAPAQLALSNVTFASGSRLLIGDTTTATTSDDAANTLNGTAGRDYLNGWGGVDTMNGGAGDDAYYVTAGDVISDSAGIDTVYSVVSYTLSASSGAENLTMLGTTAGTVLNGNQLNNVLIGSDASNASINGRAGNDTMYGMGGNDTFDMSTGGTSTYGDDVIDGGAGVDTIDFGANARSTLNINLATGLITGGGDAGVGTVAIVNVENAVAGAFRDRMIGNSAANFLYGGAADDTLDGGAGNDRLEGGTGFDQYVFSVSPGAANADTIVGFVGGSSEKIVLTTGAHANLGAAGNFTATDARFAAGAGFNSARDSTDRVVYNTTTGQLWYDSDGSGGAGAQLIATLQGAPTVIAADIVVMNTAGSGGGATAGNDSLTGTAGNDTIDGLAGNDTIVGLGGNDSLLGGAGNDVFRPGNVADPGRDFIDGGDGIDTIDYSEARSAIAGSLTEGGFNGGGDGGAGSLLTPRNVENVIGGAFDDWIDGNEAANRLEGGEGNDTLIGESGADTLDGGQGNDLYRVDAGDVLVDVGGIDTVVTSGNWTLAGGFENLTLDATGTTGPWPYAEGNELANVMQAIGSSSVALFGLGGDDQLISGAAGDNLAGGAGNDTAYGNDGNDDLRGGSGNDWMDGGNGHDNLVGSHGDDTLYGGWGSDRFFMSPEFASGTTSFGNDVIDGGGDFDWIEFYWGSTSGVTVNLTNGTATHAQGTASFTNIEGVVGGYGNDTISGNAGSNYLHGWDGNDVLYGNGGQDTLDGGAGVDEFVFNVRPVWGNGAIVLGFAPGADTLVFDLAAYAHLGLTGDFSANDVRFYAAPDAWSGHDADDRIVYNTTYGYLYYDPDGSGERSAEYVATLSSAPTLAASDIRVIGTPPTGGTLTGTEGDDSLEGSDAADTILGLGGNDTINAYDSDDSISGGSGNDRISASYGADTVDGGIGNDTLYGDDGADSLLGGEGDDWIYTGAGADTADGGAGDDYLVGAYSYYSDDKTPQHLSGGEGHDTLYSGVGDDVLAGGNGNDYLWGGGGADTLDGGLGNDSLAVEPEWTTEGPKTNDSTVIIDAGGVDTIIAIHQDWTLAAGFEHLALEPAYYEYGDAGDRILIGNALDNHIDGSWAASARIEGRDGNDTLLGGWGSGWDSGEDAFNWLDGGAGNDVLEGSYGQDTLLGGSGNDYLETYYDSDVLDGGQGNDTLVGGESTEWRPGSDLFRFNVAPGAANADRLVDFESGEDKIELANIAHAGIGTSGNFAADDERFYAAAGATSGAEVDDRVIYDTSTGNLYYDADGSAAGAALLIATLQNAPTLAAVDFIVTGDPIGGTEGNDSIVGTAAADTIDGGGGNDTISALAGDDVLLGGAGNDSLDGGDGRDNLAGGGGNDTLNGGTGLDTLDAGLGDDTYWATAGDVLVDAGGTDHVFAYQWKLGDGFENLTVTYYGEGNALDNVLRGDPNVSVTLYGYEGNDTLEANGGWFNGGQGNDTVRLTSTWSGSIYGGDGDDLLIGGDAGDGLSGNRGNDTMSGGGGDDTFYMYNEVTAEGPDYGTDQIDGGAGTDWLYFDYWTAGKSAIAVDLAAGTLSGGGASGNGATLANIEGAVGTQSNDSIAGSAQANQFYGEGGDDRLDGRAGNDTLSGGDGADTYLFTVTPGAANADIVLNFTSGSDKIRLDAAVMPRLGTTGNFSAGDERFHRGSSALETDDRVVYNSTTGELWYDADGSGAGAASLIAKLSTGAALAATDIAVDNGTVPIRGTEGNDTLNGTTGDDFIEGLGGNDRLSGSGGNDRILAGAGADTLDGGPGNDTLEAGSDSDADAFILGAPPGAANFDYLGNFRPGEDKVRLDANAMPALGVSGNFTADDARFYAADGATGGHDADDRIVFNTSTAELFYDADGSGAGVAQLIAFVPFDSNPLVATDIIVDNGTAPPPPPPPTGGQTITGTAGNDSLTGTAGNDTLDGLGGNDTLDGGLGDDKYIAQAGDVLVDSGGADTLETPSAWDLFFVSIENVTLTGTSAVGILANDLANNIVGNSANNSLQGRGGNDTISGGGGNDYFKMTTGGEPGFGSDVLDGGDGVDMVDYGGTALSALTVDLLAGTVAGGETGGGGGASLVSIESFTGGNFNDRVSATAGNNQLVGNAGNDTLVGLAGHDSLNGGDGNDWLNGGRGFDTLVGGAGADSFVFAETGSSDSARITDFVSGSDELLLDNIFFTQLGTDSVWAAGEGRFHSAPGAVGGADANDRLVYNPTNGNLYYDPDGSGAAAGQLVATLANLPALSASDITVL